MKKFTKENAGEFGTDKLSYKYKKDTPGQSSNGKNMKEKQSDKSLDIKSLEKLIKNPSPRMVKMYGKSKYINMLKNKLAKLQEEKKDFEPHMMYDPKTGKGYKANTHDDHLKMKDMGYTHEKPTDVKEDVELQEAASFGDIEKVMSWAKKNIPSAKLDISKKYGTAFINLTIFTVITLRLGGKKGIVATYDDRSKGKGDAREYHFTNASKAIDFVKHVYDEMPKKESVDLEEAVKFWKVTITKKAGKLFKGQTVDVKARNSAEAIKKGIKQMKGNPALVPGGSVDAVLGESTDIEENIGVKDGRRVVVKALTKPAALRLKKKLRNKFSSWDTSIDKSGLSMIVPNEKPIIRYLQKQPEVDTIGESTEIHENKETESELQEAAPFKSLEQKWLATKGDKKKQERLIKKHSLKPLISKVRPGAVKLGVLNDLSAKGTNNATFAGLDADGELIFVTNNPTKIYYAKKGSKRPKGMELEDVDLDNLRLQRIVEVAVGEENSNEFISEAGVDLTWTPSMIQKEYKKYLGNS